MHHAGRLSSEEFWAWMAQLKQRMRAAAEVLPCYGLAAWAGLTMAGDFAFEGEQPTATGLAYGAPVDDNPGVHVHTTTADPVRMATELRMAGLGPAFGRDDYADNLRRLDAVEPRIVSIPVDGVATRFESWSDGNRWWAAAGAGDLAVADRAGDAVPADRSPRGDPSRAEAGGRPVGIVVEARRVPIEGVALVRVTDIEPFLEGRRAYLRARRGEA